MPRQHVLVKEKPTTAEAAEVLCCPRCSTDLSFARCGDALIDACGFESYRFACDVCGAQLAGIVDPADDALLLSELAA